MCARCVCAPCVFVHVLCAVCIYMCVRLINPRNNGRRPTVPNHKRSTNYNICVAALLKVVTVTVTFSCLYVTTEKEILLHTNQDHM